MSKVIAQIAAVASSQVEVKEPVYSTKEMVAVGMIAKSPFADENGAVPSVMLASQYEADIQASVPGVIASLNKKGLALSKLVKGVRVVSLTASGKEVAKLFK